MSTYAVEAALVEAAEVTAAVETACDDAAVVDATAEAAKSRDIIMLVIISALEGEKKLYQAHVIEDNSTSRKTGRQHTGRAGCSDSRSICRCCVG